MTKKVFFDLDGTVYDLYGMDGWLDMLRNEKAGAFTNGSPLVDMDVLRDVVGDLAKQGWTFGVITWLPMEASPEYEVICTEEKRKWVAENMPFVSEFYAQSYGVPKQDAVAKRAKRMILIDDNAEVCNTWNTNKMRKSINLNKDLNAIQALEMLLDE